MSNDGQVVIELVGKDSATQAFVKSFGDIEKSVKSLADSGQQLKQLGTGLDSIWGSVQKLAGIAGIGLSLNQFWSSFKEITSAEAALGKMASRLNTTVTDLSSMGVMARKTGMDTDAFNVAVERMQKNISNAVLKLEASAGAVDEFGEPLEKSSKTLDELGLRADVLNKMPLPEKLKAISEAMKDNIAPADQSRIAIELFGRAAGAMVLALKAGPEELQKWIDRQIELGIITDEMAKRGGESKQAAGDLAVAWHQFGVEMVDFVAPAISKVTLALTDLLVAARKDKLGSALNLVSQIPGVGAVAGVIRAGKNLIQPQVDYAGYDAAAAFFGSYVTDPDNLRKPPVRPVPKPTGGGGGGAGEQSMAKFIEQMNQETAKGAGDTEVILSAWYGKQLVSIQKWKDAGLNTTEALAATDAAYYSKLEKLNSDFTEWYIAGLGKTYEALYVEEDKKLKMVSGNAAKTAQVQEVFSKKWADLQENQQITASNLFKGYLDHLAQLSPLLSQQLGYKQQVLDLELKLGDEALARQLRDEKITQADYDQAKAIGAVVNQAKQYSLEREKWQTQGISGGLQGFALERRQEQETRGYTATKDTLKGIESYAATAAGNFLSGFLTGKKTDWQKIGQDIGTAAANWLGKLAMQKLFDLGASMAAKFAPSLVSSAASTTGAAGQSGAVAANTVAVTALGAQMNILDLGLEIVDLGMDILVIALEDLTVAVEEMTFATSISAFFSSHSGGVVAHGGLAPDERFILAQTGEGIIRRDTMAAYARAGIGFDDLNNGRLPILAAGGSGGGGDTHLHLHPGAIQIDARGADRGINWDQVARQQIIPALNRHLGRGKKLGA